MWIKALSLSCIFSKVKLCSGINGDLYAIGPYSPKMHVALQIFSSALQLVIIYCGVLNGNQMV